jgi:uncharacterized C2H2 Zn-finger protein
MEYQCEKCEKVFKLKTDYTRHLARKNPCNFVDPKKELECEFCHKKYTRQFTLKRHQLSCPKKVENISIGDNSNHNTVLNQSNHNIINPSITINIVPFLGENMDKLTIKDKKGILKKCYMAIPELIRQVNFNPNIPENHNVFISSIKSKYGNVNDGKKWIIMKVDQLLDDLINKKKDDIEDLLEEFEDEIPEKVINKIREVITSIDYDPMDEDVKDKKLMKFKKLIKDEVKMLLYNNKDIVQATQSNIIKANKTKI